MNNKLLMFFLLFFIHSFLVNPSYAKTYHIALFIPEQTPFWQLVENISQEAANDLGMKLHVYNARSNHYLMLEQVTEAVSGPNKVDGIIFPDFRNIALKIIKIAEKAEVIAYSFNSPVQRNLSEGNPRGKYKYWIGSIFPNDEEISKIIMMKLIAEAKKNATGDEKIYAVGIAGRIADSSSKMRIKGVNQAIKDRDDVILQQIVWAEDWGKKQGINKYHGLLKRYPQTKVVWSASYQITNGILNGAQRTGKILGENIFTNSIGLTEEIIGQVVSEEVVVTAGGHYIEGAGVLVQLYDYFNGIDFISEGLSQKTDMLLVTKDNVGYFCDKITNEKFSKINLTKIDFTQYSKIFNPDLKRYQFSVESILNQL